MNQDNALRSSSAFFVNRLENCYRIYFQNNEYC